MKKIDIKTVCGQMLRFLTTETKWNPGQSILLAISGGMDSVCLGHLLHKAGIPFGLAHANFQLRGDDSLADEDFVKNLAELWQVPFHHTRFNTSEYAKEHGLSIQMAARDLRYRWLEACRSKYGFFYIATAHHLDDSFETSLLNLSRGTGISGLRGMLPMQGSIIRPVLFLSRQEIESLVLNENLNWREDASNREDKYKRNLLRHQVVPILKELNPSLIENFKDQSRYLRDAEMIYKTAIEKKLRQLLIKRGNEIWITKNALLTSAYGQTLLFEALRPYDFHSDMISQIWQCMEEGQSGMLFGTGRWKVLNDRSHLILFPALAQESGIALLHESETEISNSILRLTIHSKADLSKLKEPMHALLKADSLEFPLTLRVWKKGDYFYPFGMNMKKKKVSEFLTNLKLPLQQKQRICVLLSGSRIVWIPGFRVDQRFAVNTPEEAILHLEITFNESH